MTMMAHWWLVIGVVVQCVCSMMEKHDTSRNLDPKRCNSGPKGQLSAVHLDLDVSRKKHIRISMKLPSQQSQSSTLEASSLCVVCTFIELNVLNSRVSRAKECIHSVTLVALSNTLWCPLAPGFLAPRSNAHFWEAKRQGVFVMVNHGKSPKMKVWMGRPWKMWGNHPINGGF